MSILVKENVVIFPGIPPSKLVGKSFETFSIDIQRVNSEGQISHSWHIDDWASAVSQMLNGDPAPGLLT